MFVRLSLCFVAFVLIVPQNLFGQEQKVELVTSSTPSTTVYYILGVLILILLLGYLSISTLCRKVYKQLSDEIDLETGQETYYNGMNS